MVHKFDALILGGGAAGLMCAIEAGKRGRRVAVLEHAERLGKKILISGGGRCNFTNIHCSAESFVSANPHFAKSALARYTPDDFIALVEKHHIPYHEKTLGQLFCDRSAQDILDMLEKECRENGVQLFPKIAIHKVTRTDEFVATAAEQDFHAPALVVATGGLSIPKMGATAFGYDLAGQFGLKIRETRPGLVPLLFGAEDGRHYTDLAGVSADVIATCNDQRFREKMLITHRGLSGPAILQISTYWRKPESISIDLAPELGRHRGATRVCGSAKYRIAADSVAQISPQPFCRPVAGDPRPKKLDELFPSATGAHHAQLDRASSGNRGLRKAEVTAGGVDTDELSPKTMESRKVSGLFFIGEVVDVTGHLGGFNFQWAWASGASAGRAL